MSVAQLSRVRVDYRLNPWWNLKMIPWHRQVISLIYGLGVIMIALWALDQGSGAFVILGVVGMSMLTLMLIFGVEVDSVQVSANGFLVDFTDTSDPSDNESDSDE